MDASVHERVLRRVERRPRAGTCFSRIEHLSFHVEDAPQLGRLQPALGAYGCCDDPSNQLTTHEGSTVSRYQPHCERVLRRCERLAAIARRHVAPLDGGRDRDPGQAEERRHNVRHAERKRQVAGRDPPRQGSAGDTAPRP